MDFENWLKQNKGLSHKVSHDVISRLKRVQYFLATDTIDLTDLDLLENCPSFKNLSLTVKSQLRRSVRLYCEYLNK